MIPNSALSSWWPWSWQIAVISLFMAYCTILYHYLRTVGSEVSKTLNVHSHQWEQFIQRHKTSLMFIMYITNKPWAKNPANVLKVIPCIGHCDDVSNKSHKHSINQPIYRDLPSTSFQSTKPNKWGARHVFPGLSFIGRVEKKTSVNWSPFRMCCGEYSRTFVSHLDIWRFR